MKEDGTHYGPMFAGKILGDRRVLGKFELSPQHPMVHIDYFEIRPMFRRHGYGRRAWQLLESWLIGEGCERAVLFADGDRAIGFWKAVGFRKKDSEFGDMEKEF